MTPLVERRPADGIAVAVAPPYEQDGTGVIAVTAVRRHTARRPGDEGRGFDAELSGSQPLGAFVVRHGRVRWQPAIDLTRLLTTAEIVVGGVLVARQLAARPGSAKAAVVMGPGGWVSMKGGRMAVRPARRGWRSRPSPARPVAAPSRRPWWARLLRAAPLDAPAG
jgi:hypothetical protein